MACRNCDLWANATQTVFGQGSARARVALVGEQPGDQEDRQGEPFVGPAGRVLAEALERAGFAGGEVYLTNAVKHFKWVPKGKRRIHERPNVRQVRACRPWLEQEIALIQPELVVCLGATAAQSLFGPEFRVTAHRGEPLTGTGFAPVVMVTIHPSSVLRQQDSDARHQAMAAFVEDLRAAHEFLAPRPAGAPDPEEASNELRRA